MRSVNGANDTTDPKVAAEAREYAQKKVLLKPRSNTVASEQRLSVSRTMHASTTSEDPFRSTNMRRVAASDTGRRAIQDLGEEHYYQEYFNAAPVLRKAMQLRLKEQQADHDVEVAALLQEASLEAQPSSRAVSQSPQAASSYDYAADQKRVEAEADDYASDCLARGGPAQQENMTLFNELRNEYLFADQTKREELKAIIKQFSMARSMPNTSPGFLTQATRSMSRASSSVPSISEEDYVQRAVVAFKDFGMNARDARHNYKEASKNPEELRGLEQTLIEMERENKRQPRP